MTINPLEVFTILLSGKKIKESKDAKELATTQLELDQWLEKQEYLQTQKEIYDEKKRKIKIKDERIKRKEDLEFKLTNLPYEKQVEAMAKFDADMITEGLAGYAIDREGKKLPPSVYVPRVVKQRKDIELRDKLESEKQSFLQTQRLEQSDIALRTATLKAENEARAEFAKQGYGNLEKPNMSFQEFAIAVKNAKEKDALAVTSAKEKEKIIQKYVGMGYGNLLRDENGNNRPYEDFIKLAVEQEQTDILKRKKDETTQEKEIGATFDRQKREEVALEDLKKKAFEYGIDINDEKYTVKGQSWKDDLRSILGGQESALTLEEKNSLNLLNKENEQNMLNKIAGDIEKVKNTEYTLFKDVEGVEPFVMPKKFADSKITETDRLRLFDRWTMSNFDKVALATQGLKNPDMVDFVNEFSNTYANALLEQTKPTEKGMFKPTSLGTTFLSSHPYFRQIIKRHHNRVFNIGNLMKEGAILKAIRQDQAIPTSDVAQVTDANSRETSSGIIINWAKGTPEENEAYFLVADEVDKNRGIQGDGEALMIAMANYAGTKFVNGNYVPDLSTVKFYTDMLGQGFTMTQMRQYDPSQTTDKGGPIEYNHDVTQAITRTANKYFTSPLPFITALSVTAKSIDTGLPALAPAEYAKQQGVDLQAVTKQNFDANDLINDADAGLRSLTNDDLKKLRDGDVRNGLLLQNDGVYIESDPNQTSELFGAPLNTYSTLFSTLGDQVSAVIETAKDIAGIEDSKLGGAIIRQYDQLDDKNRRWSNYQTDVNPETGRTYLEEEAIRRGMSINTFLKAEERARQQTLKQLGAAQAVLDDPNADQAARVAARRQFYAFTMAYKLASLLQGGTGGRTISDQDVQNMFRVLSQDALTSPIKFGESMLNIKRMAKNILEVNQMVQIGLGIGSNGETPNRHLFLAAQHYKGFHAGTFTPTYNNVVNFIRYGNPAGQNLNPERNALDTSGLNSGTQKFMQKRIYPEGVPKGAVDFLFNQPTEEMLQYYIDEFGEDKVPKGFTVTPSVSPEQQINQAAGMTI
jgi:hypothetical protein